MAVSRREQLIDTAVELFYRDGFHATGIDKILAQAGVAKMTLYKHFKSKDELILAALRRRDEQFRNWFMRAVEGRAADPRERLLAVFDALGEWFARPNFRGCMFVNASAEYCNCDDPINVAAAEHKRLVRNYVRGLAKDAAARDPDELADQLMLVIEGATAMAHTCAETGAAARARRTAEILLDHAGV